MEINHDYKLERRPEYGLLLKTVREQKGITQRELSKALGYSPMGISHFENGERVPNLETLDKWATYLGLTLSISFKK